MRSKVSGVVKRIIKKYIDENLYLFSTDDAYTTNCHLKPRIISGAVETSCSECHKQKLLKDCDEKCLRTLSMESTVFALEYVDAKTKRRVDKKIGNK